MAEISGARQVGNGIEKPSSGVSTSETKDDTHKDTTTATPPSDDSSSRSGHAQSSNIENKGNVDEHAGSTMTSRKRLRTSSPEPSNATRAKLSEGPETDAAPIPSTKELEAQPKDDLEEGEHPPLPPGPPPPDQPPSDGWEAIWEETTQAYYFYNHYTGITTWTNPRVPEAHIGVPPAPGTTPSTLPTTTSNLSYDSATQTIPPTGGAAAIRPHGGYDPSIHGDYDPNADYAQITRSPSPPPVDAEYVAKAAFNRFTGKFQPAHLSAERHNDENKSKRQMEVYFDVDAAANSHDGKSLKAERQAKRLTKQEVKAFKEKSKQKKEEKRRAWLKD